MESELTFDIGHLSDQSIGSTERYTIDVPVKFDDIKLKSNISAKVEIMKTKGAFEVTVKHLKGSFENTCQRCLEAFSSDFMIESAHRTFYYEEPQKCEDIHDIYIVDKKKLEIDIKEMLRQEIILHFPVISVCSTSCKGLCAQCGKDLNKETCVCSAEEPIDSGYKPLAALKDLIK